jgi:hypothetical protein
MGLIFSKDNRVHPIKKTPSRKIDDAYRIFYIGDNISADSIDNSIDVKLVKKAN